ncbi:MAG: coenzyme F420-0:L-glutamate ligase [Gammaproteobacteria bacterium]|nr:coenzyme F420-0:L-glutamate ligase [Gammaproteobacteria bacterium]
MTDQLTLEVIHNVPLICSGDDLSVIITIALSDNGMVLRDGDILVLAQKIVSKATGCFVDLKKITPSQRALELAKETEKDPRLVEVILTESKSVIRKAPGILITEHRLGWIMANAGIDASNVKADAGDDTILLLPQAPDKFCEELREQLRVHLNIDVGVLINDSFGRPWRVGTTGVALGAAGLTSLWDQRGETDLFGRELKVSQQAIGDELAAAASLLQGQGAEGKPVILVRGLKLGVSTKPPSSPAGDLIRNASEDLFR